MRLQKEDAFNRTAAASTSQMYGSNQMISSQSV
jgi:hypothetical protein